MTSITAYFPASDKTNGVQECTLTGKDVQDLAEVMRRTMAQLGFTPDMYTLSAPVEQPPLTVESMKAVLESFIQRLTH